MVAILGLVAAYDLFAFYYWGREATVSDVIRALPSSFQLLIAFALGALFGHLFLTD